MTLRELKAVLNREGISPASYDLDGEGRDETYCIDRTVNGWVVYYRERGNRNFEHQFPDEGEACDFFLKEVFQDPTTRK